MDRTSAFSVFSTHYSFSMSLIMQLKKSQSFIWKGILSEWLTLEARKIRLSTEVYNFFLQLSSPNNSSVKPTMSTCSGSQRWHPHAALRDLKDTYLMGEAGHQSPFIWSSWRLQPYLSLLIQTLLRIHLLSEEALHSDRTSGDPSQFLG